MAREFAKVYMSIWETPTSPSSQSARSGSMFLILQPDLSRAGTIGCWRSTAGCRASWTTREELLSDLAELASTRSVAVDESTEELLVRSYIRNDDGWKSPNIMIRRRQQPGRSCLRRCGLLSGRKSPRSTPMDCR